MLPVVVSCWHAADAIEGAGWQDDDANENQYQRHHVVDNQYHQLRGRGGKFPNPFRDGGLPLPVDFYAWEIRSFFWSFLT